ncbi:hypothetical protein Y1Q_0004664 [Alligator mississippiensis]|uniref:Uncharacterized protein n=1 Tax=Alligator mississippiensis TaxID=8496 RepID=A0A151NRQ5_ALLMI|nr:hypothetical protein Y1Q_0004664 [Alligator mississippiensis]
MCPHGSIEIAAYRAGVALGAAAFLTVTILLLLQRHKATSARTQEQQLMQGDAQVSSERSDNMHYAEPKLTSRQGAARAPIWNKPQENTEYAPIQTRPL